MRCVSKKPGKHLNLTRYSWTCPIGGLWGQRVGPAESWSCMCSYLSPLGSVCSLLSASNFDALRLEKARETSKFDTLQLDMPHRWALGPEGRARRILVVYVQLSIASRLSVQPIVGQQLRCAASPKS